MHKPKCVICTSRRMKVARRAKLTARESRASFSSSNDELSRAARTSIHTSARFPLRVKVCKMLGAPCDTIASAARRSPPRDNRPYGLTKPFSLRFSASLAALRTPVSEVIAASPADQWRARARRRGQPLAERPQPAPARPPARRRPREFEDPNLAGARRPRSRESGPARARARGCERDAAPGGCVTLLKYFR